MFEIKYNKFGVEHFWNNLFLCKKKFKRNIERSWNLELKSNNFGITVGNFEEKMEYFRIKLRLLR